MQNKDNKPDFTPPWIRKELSLLFDVAERGTGQSVRCRRFLLAWWNASEHGGFDLTDMWGVDTDIAKAMSKVFAFVAINQSYMHGTPWEVRFQTLAVENIKARG